MLGDKMLVQLNLVNRYWDMGYSDRQTDIQIKRSYSETDTIIYLLPEGYETDKLPESFASSTNFGTYSAKAMADDNRIIYYRTFTIKKGIYPKDNYPELADFLLKILKEDQNKAVIKKI